MNFKCVGLLALACMAVGLVAADKKMSETAGDAATGRPDFNNTWALSGPYTLEGLKGKLVVIRFFETGCPTCRATWPGMDEIRKSYDNQPVLFIGVSSGHPTSQVTTYAKAVKTEWSIYSDIDRSFETAYLKQVISLQNIYQNMIITPTGEFRGIGEIKAAVDRELPNAKWKMDPKEVPAALKKAWFSLEFGQTAQAVTTIKQALGATDAVVKAAAQKLDAVVKEDIVKRMAEAAEKVAAQQPWEGYKVYDFVTQNYKPYPEAAKAKSEMTTLESDAKVKKEKAAKIMLDKIQEWANSKVKTDRDNAKAGLTILQRDYADTEAGKSSQNVKVLDKV